MGFVYLIDSCEYLIERKIIIGKNKNIYFSLNFEFVNIIGSLYIIC